MLDFQVLNDTHHVSVYLPCLQCAPLKTFVAMARFSRPMSLRKLVVFGDSIAQGFVVGALQTKLGRTVEAAHEKRTEDSCVA